MPILCCIFAPAIVQIIKTLVFMEFGINYRDGYEVCVLLIGIGGRKQYFPLRNFGDHQGDARIFKEVDCPNLSDSNLRMLIKSFNRKFKFKRINSKRFVRDL